MSSQQLEAVKAVRKTLKASKNIDKLLKKKETLEAKIQKLNIDFTKKMMDGSTTGMESVNKKIDKAKQELVKVIAELKSLDALRGGRRKTRRSTKRN